MSIFKRWIVCIIVVLSGSCIAGAAEKAEQIGPRRAVLAADYGKKKIFLFNADGSVAWEQPIAGCHDAHVLANGNILYQASWTRTVEMTRDGKVVWEYDSATANGNAGKKVEVHAIQRLDNGNTMLAESGTSRLIEVDRAGKLVHEVKLQVEKPHHHRDTRLVRKTDAGTYLVAHESEGKVKEYDGAGKVIWEYEVPLFDKPRKGGHGLEAWGNSVFSAVRLANGNTLIGTGNGHSVIEVTPEKQIVWHVKQNDLAGVQLAWVCRVERLENGNTFLVNCHAGPGNPQLLEVTPEKKVVWSLRDFERLGDATPVGVIVER